MTTLFYAVAAQNFLGLKGEKSVISWFIKSQAWGKLTGCEDDFDCLVFYLEERFSYEEVQVKRVCLPVKTSFPYAKNVCK